MASSLIGSPSKFIIIIIIVIFNFFVSSTITTTASNPSGPFQNIYAFGDSYTDTGNTNSSTPPAFFKHVSNLPYGQTFFHRPTNRFSDGRLVIDFVAQALSLPFLQPYRNSNAATDDKSHGVNFAVAGCTAIYHKFFVKNLLILNKTPESLNTQLGWFNKVLESKGCKKGSSSTATISSECRAVFDNALIWVGEIGINDYIYALPSLVSRKTIQDLAIATETSFLKELLSKGAKYIVVQGLPPIGCLTVALYLIPHDRDELGCVGSLNKQSYNHNAVLRNKLTQFQKQFPESVIVYADYWNSYVSVLRSPAWKKRNNSNANNTYGSIKEVFKTCCGFGGGPYNFDLLHTCGSTFSTSYPNPSEFINWDGIHLTEAMHEVLANSFINGPFCYPPFQDLVKMKLN